MKEFKVRLTDKQIKEIEIIFWNENFKSRAEVIRKALDEYLKIKKKDIYIK